MENTQPHSSRLAVSQIRLFLEPYHLQALRWYVQKRLSSSKRQSRTPPKMIVNSTLHSFITMFYNFRNGYG